MYAVDDYDTYTPKAHHRKVSDSLYSFYTLANAFLLKIGLFIKTLITNACVAGLLSKHKGHAWGPMKRQGTGVWSMSAGRNSLDVAC